MPIPLGIADRLRALDVADGELVFKSTVGTLLDPDNLSERVLAPACAEAGVEWAGFHTFRHTVASRLFAAGRNAVQVQRWLGHHSAAFTLSTYVHLLDGDLGEPIEATNPRITDPGVGVIPSLIGAGDYQAMQRSSAEVQTEVLTDSTPQPLSHLAMIGRESA